MSKQIPGQPPDKSRKINLIKKQTQPNAVLKDTYNMQRFIDLPLSNQQIEEGLK